MNSSRYKFFKSQFQRIFGSPVHFIQRFKFAKRLILNSLFFLSALIWLLNLPVNIIYAQSEQDRIHQLLQKMERAYANRDLEGYTEVLHDQFEYQSDVGTPEDASDDISGITKELERESALRVFEQFYTLEIDLLSELEIKVTGDRATAKSEYTIIAETFDPANSTLYMRGKNTFSLVKKLGQWKIIQQQDNALSTKEIETTKILNEYRTPDDLINALGGELRVWAPAMFILEGKVDSEAMTDNLFTIVKNGRNLKIRARAARLLARSNLNEAKIRILANIYQNPRTDVTLRIAILSALSTQRDQTAAETMKKAAVDGHPEVRAFATIHLSQFQSADVQKYIMDALRDSAAKVRRAAVEAILINDDFLPHDKLSDSLKKLIQNPNEELPTRKAALHAFIKNFGSTSGSMITDIVTNTSFPDALRTETIHILEEKVYNEPKIIEKHLLTILQNPNEAEILRAAAISALSRYATENSLVPLTKALSSSSKRFKARACSTLGRIQAEGVVEPILKLALNQKEHIHVRRAAVESLWMLEANDSIPSLAQLLKDKSEPGNLLGIIITILGKWQDERALNALLHLISSEDEPWWLRRAAIRNLKNPREPRTVAALNQLLNDNDERLRKAAMEILKMTKAEL